MSRADTAVIVGETIETKYGTFRNTLVRDLQVGDRYLAEMLPNGTFAMREIVEIHRPDWYTDVLLDGSNPCDNFTDPLDTRAVLMGGPA